MNWFSKSVSQQHANRRRSLTKQPSPLHFETLEPRQMLSGTTVTEADPSPLLPPTSLTIGTPVTDPSTIIVTGDFVLNARADAPSFTGVLTATDADEPLFYEFADGVTTSEYGSFSIDFVGNWNYVPSTDFAFLDAGEILTETFDVFVVFGDLDEEDQVPLTEATVTINIEGVDNGSGDDTIDVSGDLLLDTNEDAASFTGTLSAVDADNLLTLSFAPVVDVQGQRGAFSINEDGEWSYAPSPELQTLRSDQSITESFEVSVGDAVTPLATTTVTINIEGRNDAAVIAGELTIDTGAEVDGPITGTLSVTDIDAGESSFVESALTGVYGSFSINDAGEWTYTVDSAATQNLPVGQTRSDLFTVQSIDGTSETLTLQVRGQFVGTTITGNVSNNISENLGGFEGSLVARTSDGQVIPFVATTVTTEIGTFNLSPNVNNNNSWLITYEFLSPTTDILAVDETRVESFTVEAVDGTTKEIVFTIFGRDNNEYPLTGDLTGTISEDALNPITGTVATQTPPEFALAIFPVPQTDSGELGTFQFDDTGQWTFTLSAAAQSLSAGETATESFAFAIDTRFETTVIDRTVGSVEITVVGEDDPSNFAGDLTGTANEDTTLPITGIATVVDTDAVDASIVASTATGNFGSFEINTAGEWAYTIDNDSVDNLSDTDSVVDQFTITSTDGTTQIIAVTITGVNDAGIIGGTLVGTADEDTTTAITGIATIQDAEADAATIVASAATGDFGSFEINAAGEWTYVVDNGAAASLRATDLVADQFTISASDGATETVTVTISGVNDAATFSGALTGTAEEDSTTPATGTVTVSDVDTNEAAILASTIVGEFGSFEIDATGNWTYAVDNTAVNSLAESDSVIDSFTITSLDGTPLTVAVTVEGRNDAAIIAGQLAGNTNEDATTAVTGSVSVEDLDTGEAEIIATTSAGNFGSFEINAAGQWTYTVDNGAADVLTATDSVIDQFTITSIDGTTQTLAITIAGRNDAATIGGQLTGATNEDALTPTTGTVTVDDVDSGEDAVVAGTATGNFGSFTIDAAGEWTYAVNNTAADRLTSTDSVSDQFTVTSIDGTTQTVIITVAGENDAAIIGGQLTGTINEDATTPIEGAVSVDDVDLGEATIVATALAGSFGSFAINAAGQWTYTVDNAAANSLAATDSVNDLFTIASVDGTTQTVTVTINGQNDAAIIGGQLSGATSEDATTPIIRRVTVSDVDSNEAVIVASTFTGNFGTLAIDAAGEWTYTVDNAAAASLRASENPLDQFTITSADGTAQTISIAVAGRNDAAVISGDLTGSVEEDAAVTTGVLTIDDSDDGESAATPTTQAGEFGVFNLDASGEWTYTVDNAAADVLSDGEAIDEVFAVSSVDGTQATVVVTVIGQEDSTEIDSVRIEDGVLVITGSDGVDNQVFVNALANGDVQVVINGQTTVLSGDDVESISIVGGDGDDFLIVGGEVTTNVMIDGGAGDDLIAGGGGDDQLRGGEGDDAIYGRNGDDIVLGQAGMDSLFGMNGQDVLIGGDDADFIRGGNGEDLIIGGLVSFADDQDLLDRLSDEWSSNRNYFVRVIRINFGVGENLDGFRLRVGETVFSDGVQDNVRGGRGWDRVI